MPSILPGFEYDIFISYRQNDNKREKWVTNFVQVLRDELEATLKNPVSIYFDENPHDGLLETHQVGATLEKKLKCLVFIPVLSQTYCDENGFAWSNEFIPFIEQASSDELGMNITLSNGNVASRVLPVRIHELDSEDQSVLEAKLQGPIRAIDFIYQEPGVNRPLKPQDRKDDNLNKTSYHNQINKLANALKELGTAMLRSSDDDPNLPKIKNSQKAPVKKLTKKVLIGLAAVVALAIGYWGLSNYSGQKNTASTEVTQSQKVIAVLPFSNTKPDPDSDYLGFAIANQVIGALDHNKNLTIRPSSTVRQYDQQVYDSKQVADALGVGYVLTGNYLIIDNIIRLNIEFIDAKLNTSLWRKELEVGFNNAFDLQDMVAQEVVEQLRVQAAQKEIDRDISQNPLAYEYYLRSLSYPLSNEGDRMAIEMLDKSIELDSNYAPAFDQLGSRTTRLAQFGLLGPEGTLQGEKYFLKALSLNNESLSALTNLSMLYTETARADKAVELTRRVLEINPNHANARFSLGYIYRYKGMLEESALEMEKALALDPTNFNYRSLGVTYLNLGEYDKAHKALRIDSGSAYALGYQGLTYTRQGQYKKAVQYFDQVIAMNSQKLWSLVAISIKSYIEGNIEAGLVAMRELEAADLADAEAWYYWGSHYALLGDKPGYLRCFRRALDNGYFNYPFMLNDPFLEGIQNDPDFQTILQEAKEKHLAFKAEFFK